MTYGTVWHGHLKVPWARGASFYGSTILVSSTELHRSSESGCSSSTSARVSREGLADSGHRWVACPTVKVRNKAGRLDVPRGGRTGSGLPQNDLDYLVFFYAYLGLSIFGTAPGTVSGISWSWGT